MLGSVFDVFRREFSPECLLGSPGSPGASLGSPGGSRGLLGSPGGLLGSPGDNYNNSTLKTGENHYEKLQKVAHRLSSEEIRSRKIIDRAKDSRADSEQARTMSM